MYIHGIGPQATPAVVKRKYDEALFGHDMGDRTRLAYWSDILHSVQTTETSLAKALDTDGIPPHMALRGEAKEWAKLLAEELATAPLATVPGRVESRRLAMALENRQLGAKILPPGPLRRTLTEQFTRWLVNDAYQYLFLEEIKARINRRLRDALTGSGPFLVIGHSLGSVIAYEVLSDFDSADVPLLMTLGSPLGIDEIHERLTFFKGPGTELPVPKCVTAWKNFSDPLDPVALDGTLEEEFTPSTTITDERVVNRDTLRLSGFNPHSSTGYLATEQVQLAVLKEVGAQFAAATGPFVVARDLASEMAGNDARMPVLIELNTRHGRVDDNAQEIEKWIHEAVAASANELAGEDRGKSAEVECLKRFISAKLTTAEIHRVVARAQEHQAKSASNKEPLIIHHLWKNYAKRALLKSSAQRIHAIAGRLGYQATGKGIRWAVLDTGIAGSHPHFEKHKNIKAIWDCTKPKKKNGDLEEIKPPQSKDQFGHGTHVAGIIAGTQRSETNQTADASSDGYLAGIAPECELHIYKVLDDNGNGHDSSIIKALDHIAEINDRQNELFIHGVNLSLGGPFNAEAFACGHSPVCGELRRLWRSGVLVCTAAGNEAVVTVQAVEPGFERRLVDREITLDLSIGDPANFDEGIAIGSVHKDKPHVYGISYFSSRGPTADGRAKPDVVAPGERIESCNAAFVEGDEDSHYVELSGTSMACPHVSGLLAAFLSVRREYIGRPDEVKEILMRWSTDLKRDRYHQGAGMPNLVQMLANT